jgi:hypothetical protein
MSLFNLLKKIKIYDIFGIRLKFNRAMQSLRKTAKLDAVKISTCLNINSLSTDDKIRYLSQMFYRNTDYYPDFKHPRSFNEKLNWIRFNFKDLKPVNICDKLLFKQYVEEKLGPGYTAKLLRVFDDVADLELEGLPEKFVVKTTFGFGAKAVKIIKEKSKVNLDEIKFQLSETMNPWEYTMDQGLFRKEQTVFKVFAEEYIESEDGQLTYYKFLCFHGEPKMVIAICDRENGKYSIAYYDTDWNKLDLKCGNYKNKDVKKTKNFNKMLEIAKKLSAEYPFVRVDLYNVDGKIFAGEMTFIPAGAMSKFKPVEWDYKIGEWLDLSKIAPEFLNILPEFSEDAKVFMNSREKSS